MKSIGPTTPYGYTQFCDDVRREINGKASLMGVYAGDFISYQPLPAEFLKMSLVISYLERPGESSDPVQLAVFMPGDPDNEPSFKFDTPIEEMRARAPELVESDSDPLIHAILFIDIAPLKLSCEGLIKVRAYRGDLEVRLGTLIVKHQPLENIG